MTAACQECTDHNWDNARAANGQWVHVAACSHRALPSSQPRRVEQKDPSSSNIFSRIWSAVKSAFAAIGSAIMKCFSSPTKPAESRQVPARAPVVIDHPFSRRDGRPWI